MTNPRVWGLVNKKYWTGKNPAVPAEFDAFGDGAFDSFNSWLSEALKGVMGKKAAKKLEKSTNKVFAPVTKMAESAMVDMANSYAPGSGEMAAGLIYGKKAVKSGKAAKDYVKGKQQLNPQAFVPQSDNTALYVGGGLVLALALRKRRAS